MGELTSQEGYSEKALGGASNIRQYNPVCCNWSISEGTTHTVLLGLRKAYMQGL